MKNVSNEQLLKAKAEIMEGKSITSVSKALGIDRKTLKESIIKLLNDDERQEFNSKLSSNFGGNKISSRRNKQIMANKVYEENVKKLARKGIKKGQIEAIALITKKNPKNRMSKDTFVLKLLELLEFCEERNKGISKASKGYIKIQDLLIMIQKDVKIMTSDVNRKIRPICQVLDNHESLSKEEVNVIIKENPHIFRNSVKKIDMLSAIGSNFLVKQENEYIDLLKYVLTYKPHMLAINPEKLYKRLSFLKDRKKSTIITLQELIEISRNKYKNQEANVDDEILNENYEFPEYDEKNPIEFRRKLKENLSVKKKNEIKEQ